MLRLVSYSDPPFVNDCFESVTKSAACPLPGVDIEYTITLLTMLGLPFRFIKVNGTEARDALASGSGDLTGHVTKISDKLHASFHVSFPVVVDKTVVVMQKQLQTTMRSSFIASADWKTWVAIVVTTSILGLFALINCRVLQLPLAQRMTSLTFVVWSIIGGVLLETGASFMTVNLVAPSQTLVDRFDSLPSLKSCVQERQCRLAYLSTYRNTSLNDNFFWAVNLSQKTLEEERLLTTVTSREELAEFVSSDETHIGLDYLSATEFYMTNYCNLWIKHFSGVSSQSFGYFSKNATLIKHLTGLITASSLQEYYGYLVKKYLARGRERKTCNRGSAGPTFEPLSLIKLVEAFLLLIGGSVAAVVSLLFRHLLERHWGKPILRSKESESPETAAI
jgi:hypothetical protein